MSNNSFNENDLNYFLVIKNKIGNITIKNINNLSNDLLNFNNANNNSNNNVNNKCIINTFNYIPSNDKPTINSHKIKYLLITLIIIIVMYLILEKLK